jgi:superfamily II RNA helicase
MTQSPDPTSLFDHVFSWIEETGVSLYPAQEEAILELLEGKSVILNTPTGSGKSLVATALHKMSLKEGRRSVYTCPVKALVNEKWLSLCETFGPENVGLSTGDATVNRDAPILCCTAEILSNIALSEGADSGPMDIIMDEFHYYSDKQRGVAWQVPLLTLSESRFLLMSATMGNTHFFEKGIEELTQNPCVTVKSEDRPVPLQFRYSTENLVSTVQDVIQKGQAPVYVVHFTQAEAAKNAQNFTSLDICNKEERQEIAKALEGFQFNSSYGKDIKRWLRQGIGLHHAGLLPKYRILVERLAQQGLLKVICGTDTLGVGVNVPIRTVLLTQLCKYSGEGTAILTARDFHQIVGRAGRKGFDDVGYVIAQAPAHVIENLKAAAKSASNQSKNQKKPKKVVKQKPPEWGYVPWDESTFEKLIQSEPEKLVSRFQVSHGLLLQVLSRPSDGCKELKALIADCHDTLEQRKEHSSLAFKMFRSLVERKIIEIATIKQRQKGQSKLQVQVDLQKEFAMNQPLSLFLLDTLSIIQEEKHPEEEEYALHVLSLVESIVENPDIILRKQLDIVKSETMNQMKAEGVEYEERMERLEQLEYPKPMREFLYGNYNAFIEEHPWLKEYNVKPKSIVREMVEEFLTFTGYTKKYQIQRSEGLLLRYINEVYKVLAQTVPSSFKNEYLKDIEVYLADMLLRVDSSLLQEWEKLRNPEHVEKETQEEIAFGAGTSSELLGILQDPKSFQSAIRQRVFSFMAATKQEQWDIALQIIEGAETSAEAGPQIIWGERQLQELFEEYLQDHTSFRLDEEGRANHHSIFEKLDTHWLLKQKLVDEEGFNDCELVFKVNLKDSQREGVPVIEFRGCNQINS